MIGHILLAILLQLATARLAGSWSAGAAVATSWALAREITQAEYRWISDFGGGLRENMPWWAGMDHRVWRGLDPWLDWVIPCAVTIAIALLANASFGGRSERNKAVSRRAADRKLPFP